MNNNHRDYDILKIGALLHDIGKWYKIIKENENGKHIEYGCEFIDDCCSKNKILPINLTKNDIHIIKELIANHHNDNVSFDDDDNTNYLLEILKISDALSNGELIKHTEKVNTDKYKFLPSIFENIHLNWEDKKYKKYELCKKYTISPLKINDKIIFPEFQENTSILDKNVEYDFNKNFENLLLFIQKYTWCIPSTFSMDYGNKEYVPDVSLYDHLRTTCAIACCLYMNEKNGNIDKDYIGNLLNILNKKDNPNYEEYINKNIFSLIHGDISGVQDFIFNITSKGANKSLKGRSFYLDFLTELCARYVIQELDLSLANILFYGGGHFYILSYNVDDERTKNFEEKINDILFEKFGADLYVAIGKVDLRPIDFLIEHMNEDARIGIPYKWKESAEATSKRKMRKFGYKGMELFNPEDSDGDEHKRCPICKNKIKNPHKLGNENICGNCASFIGIADFLKEFEKKNSIDYKSKNHTQIFENIKFYNIPSLKEFYSSIHFDNNSYNLPHGDGNLKIPFKIWSIAFPLVENGDKKELMAFSELAKLSEGVEKLAILKMDVDNLGKIITRGLGKYATLSRLSTLSSMLTLYFTGYIPYLIKKEYSNSVYLTYSGGDDTLIVGAWDKVWELAKKINDEFKRFVCYNPDITLSAGVVLVSPKFEYRKGVYLAEEELENAKDNKVKIDGEEKEKNSISIFGHALIWDNIEKERDYEKKFEEAIKNTNRKRILHITQKVYNNLGKALKSDVDIDTVRVNIPYLWRMKYYLYRNYKDSGEWKYVEFIDEYLSNIEKDIIDGKIESNFNDIVIASRITELKSRKEGNNELDE